MDPFLEMGVRVPPVVCWHHSPDEYGDIGMGGGAMGEAGEGEIRDQSGSGAGVSGTTLTLVQVIGDCPGSISHRTRQAGLHRSDTNDASTPVTGAPSLVTPKVIHRSYPQARQFHEKHDVERLLALWIPHGWCLGDRLRFT